ncbi:Histidine phosphatase superfamily clade-2, partial [Cryptosporidium hominis]
MRILILLSLLSFVVCVIKQERGSQIISSDDNLMGSDIILDGSVHSGQVVSPAEFSLCADTSNLEEIRKIPRLRDEKLFDTLKLVQLQMVARHGARTPIKSFKCWEGYEQNWDCSDLKSLIFASAVEKQSKTRTLKFLKHYETKQWQNHLTETCDMGQLISQGYEQHRINGKLLAEAYFKHGENLVTRNGLKIDDFMNEMYIRSSDTQRTIVSATSFITSLLEEIFGKEETFKNFKNLPIYTMDLHSEYLFANKKLVDNSQVLKRVFSSKEFRELIQVREKLHAELVEDAKLININGSWPFELLDCISMAICSDDNNKLPDAFLKNNLLERTMTAIEKEVSSVFTWDDSIIAKGDISRFMYEIRDFIVDAILFYEKKNNGFSTIKELCLNATRTKVFKSQDSLANIEYLLTPLCNKYEYYYSSKKEIKAPKFIFFSGHDLTVIPLLSSLRVWDEHLPPYASTINFEIYYDPSEGQKHQTSSSIFSKSESIQKKLPYYVRLLYNGLVITDKLEGCKGSEVCHVSF